MLIASLLDRPERRTPWTSAETPAAEAGRVMAATGVGALPVLDRHGRLLGMVEERALLRLAAERRSGIRGLAVEEVMTRDVVTLPAGTPLQAALAVMRRGGFRHLPVCDGRGRLLGLVGLADLIEPLPGPAAPAPAPEAEREDHA